MLPDMWYAQTRPTEIGLTILCLGYGTYIFLFPAAAYNSQILSELAWLGFGRQSAFGFWLKAILTGWGVLANIHGWRFSAYLRSAGAAIGSAIWSWMIYQDYTADHTLAFGSFACALFLAASLWVLMMSFANLPRAYRPGDI